jgi:hypothetical protein
VPVHSSENWWGSSLSVYSDYVQFDAGGQLLEHVDEPFPHGEAWVELRWQRGAAAWADDEVQSPSVTATIQLPDAHTSPQVAQVRVGKTMRTSTVVMPQYLRYIYACLPALSRLILACVVKTNHGKSLEYRIVRGNAGPTVDAEKHLTTSAT